MANLSRLSLTACALWGVACASTADPSPGNAGGTGASTGALGGSAGAAVGAGGSASAAGGSGSTSAGGAGSGTASGAGTGGTASGGSGGRVAHGGSSGTTPGGAAGTGGSSMGGGGSGGSGDAGGAAPEQGGTGAAVAGGAGGGAGTTMGTGGSAAGAAGQGPVTFSRPEGTIPNAPQPTTTVNLPKDQWKKGLVSPSMQVGHQINQPSVVNGYLVVGGNEEFWIHDVSNPAAPKQLAVMTTPNRTGAEAESHTVSFARYGDVFYMVTIGGRGIDTWDITNESAPKHVAQLKVTNTNYGDYTEAIWGVSWQGQYIYVGATNNGIKVVDAADPAAPKIVAEVSTSQYGGISAGALDAIGNVLVVTTPKESGGVATLDISDPTKPTRLASFTANTSYIGQFYRRWVFLINPLRAWDVLTNPKSIGTGSSPLGQLSTENSEYMSFSDDYMFLGHVRTEIGGTPGASKITVADPHSMKVSSRVWGRLDQGDKNDDQFTLPMGNLLVIGDDQAPYAGWVIAAHQTAPDETAPVVDTVIPNDQATGVSTKSRIGLSFSDNIELATVNGASFVVRPVGGQPLAGKYGVRMGVVNFDPDQDLEPGTTYEVVLPQGGIADFVGNSLGAEWKSTFTTN